MKKLTALITLWLFVMGADAFARNVARTVPKPPHSKNNFLQLLQSTCHTPRDLLQNIGQHLSTSNDYEGKVASLVLIRLAKLMIIIDNKQFELDANISFTLSNQDVTVISHVCQVLSTCIQQRDNNDKLIIDTAVDGIKAAAVLSRILQRSSVIGNQMSDATIMNMVDSCRSFDPRILEPHHLSGLIWSFDCFELQCAFNMPDTIISSFQDLKLPFRVRPGFLARHATNMNVEEGNAQFELTLENVKSQVDFSAEEIRTSNNQVVQERRQTAWQGEGDVPGFAYSGKIMETKPFSPVVRTVRDILSENMGSHYDCCLLNLYPDGDSGMRYHIDPDQGLSWGFDTCVVSVGATRRFAFRDIPGKKTATISQPHNFVVMDGDVTHMFDNCQAEFQHSVKTSEDKGEKASRSSLVFKQCLMK
jgi:alkylated DNA repair dioxygenase AlkB